MVLGLYDFVLKLPPVPAAGTYEIRMGLSNNSLRGMCQVYFGNSPNDLRPAGLPVDMRQKGQATTTLVGWLIPRMRVSMLKTTRTCATTVG